MARRRTRNAVSPLERKHGFFWGLSPRRLVVVGLVLTVLAASLGASWLVQGIRGLIDLNGPHQQWHGVVVEHHRGDLLFTTIPLQYSLVVGFIDRHNPSATFTVNVDADTYSAVPDGVLITLDLGPQSGHVYALSTSPDGVFWTARPLDPGGDQLRLLSWLLVPSGGILGLLGLLGIVLCCIGLIDFLGGTETISGMVVEVIEGSLFGQPRVIVDREGRREMLALRSSMYEKICEDGGRSQMTFVVSRRLRHVRRVRRKRSSGLITQKPAEQGQQQREEERYEIEEQGMPPAVDWSDDGTWVVRQASQEPEVRQDGSGPHWQEGMLPQEERRRSRQGVPEEEDEPVRARKSEEAQQPELPSAPPPPWEQRALRRSGQFGSGKRVLGESWQQWRDEMQEEEEQGGKRPRKQR